MLEDLDGLFACPSLHLLGEGPRHAAHFQHTIDAGDARGNLAHDGHIAALMTEHGVRELLTTDRDFKRVPGFPHARPVPGLKLRVRTG